MDSSSRKEPSFYSSCMLSTLQGKYNPFEMEQWKEMEQKVVLFKSRTKAADTMCVCVSGDHREGS